MPIKGGAAAAAIAQSMNEEDAEARVYVNNMNTAKATVTIPDRGRMHGRTAALTLNRGGGRQSLGDLGDDGLPGQPGKAGGAKGRKGGTSGGGGGNGVNSPTVVNYSSHESGKVVTKMVALPAAGGGGGGASSSGAATAGGSAAAGKRGKTLVPTFSDEDALHPNLDQVYSRIMRKLQRQLNYEELNRPSLAEQFGVAYGGDDDVVNDDHQHPQHHQNNSNEDGAAGAGGGGGGLGRLSRGESFLNNTDNSALLMTTTASRQGGPRRESAATTTQASAANAAAVNNNNASVIVSYGRRRNTSRHHNTDSYGGGGGGGSESGAAAVVPAAGGGGGGTEAAMEDIERLFAVQPCPRTLRLVIQHAQEIVTNKMAMAERSSMTDCLRLVFESRALLDRLLKEAPSYTSFPDDVEGLPRGGRGSAGGGGGGSVSRHQLQEMYQEFRKKPVLLPRAHFTQDGATGAIEVQLDLSQQVAMGIVGGANNNNNNNGDSVMQGLPPPLPPLAPPPPPHISSSRASMSGSKALVGQLSNMANAILSGGRPSVTDGAGGESDSVVLPTGYGKSGRRQRAAAAASSSMAATAQQPMAAESEMSLDCATNASTNIGVGSPLLPTTGASGTDYTSDNNMAASQQQQQQQQQQGFRGGSASRQGVHAAVTVTSVGTLTDDNASNTITDEMYGELRDYATALEVELAEAKSAHKGLSEQLLVETDYAAGRHRIIQYLRETLIRECNMLRSQLNFASLKEQQFVRERQHLQQQQLQQQQQQQQQIQQLQMQQQMQLQQQGQETNSNGGGGVGGSGAGFGISSPWRSIGGGGGNLGMSVSRTRVGGGGGGGGSSGGMPSGRQQQTGSGNADDTVSSIGGGGGGGGNNNNGGGGGGMVMTLPRTPSTRPGFPKMGGTSSPGSPGIGGGPAPESEQSAVMSASGGGVAATQDITAIQSMLDLVLLAVEEDCVFPTGLGALPTLGSDLVKQTMTKDLKHQADALRASFEEKNRRLQDSIVAQKIQNSYVVIEKDKEIARLEKLADMSYVERVLRENVAALYAEQRKLRNQIREQLQAFQVMLDTTTRSILNRTRLMDQTVTDNALLQNTQDALKDLVESAHSLLMPMMAPEYARGYHPWPLKVRNSADPLSRMIQGRYGSAEVVRLREQLTTLSELYVGLHKFAMQQEVVPDPSRPCVGAPLRLLCSRLVLNTLSTTDIIFEVRQRHDRERHLERGIARLNFRLLWNAYLQRAYTERSVMAIAEAGMDPYTTTLPVGRSVNELASARGALTHERNAMQKERIDNAKQVYRLWQSKGIDIYEGASAPATTGPKLTLIGGVGSAGSSHGAGAGGGAAAAIVAAAAAIPGRGGAQQHRTMNAAAASRQPRGPADSVGDEDEEESGVFVGSGAASGRAIPGPPGRTGSLRPAGKLSLGAAGRASQGSAANSYIGDLVGGALHKK